MLWKMSVYCRIVNKVAELNIILRDSWGGHNTFLKTTSNINVIQHRLSFSNFKNFFSYNFKFTPTFVFKYFGYIQDLL